MGNDVLCQAKSGMGKTAVFVISILQQIKVADDKPEVLAVVLCHTRELAYQICHEFTRFAEFMPNVKVGNYFGGLDVKKQRAELKGNTPAIVVGTPGRIKQLANEGALNLATVRHFVIDECDKVLEKLGEFNRVVVQRGVQCGAVWCCSVVLWLWWWWWQHEGLVLMMIEGARGPDLLLLFGQHNTTAALTHNPHSQHTTTHTADRHARRRAGHLQEDAAREAGHDVQRDALAGRAPRLQEVHVQRASYHHTGGLTPSTPPCRAPWPAATFCFGMGVALPAHSVSLSASLGCRRARGPHTRAPRRAAPHRRGRTAATTAAAASWRCSHTRRPAAATQPPLATALACHGPPPPPCRKGPAIVWRAALRMAAAAAPCALARKSSKKRGRRRRRR